MSIETLGSNPEASTVGNAIHDAVHLTRRHLVDRKRDRSGRVRPHTAGDHAVDGFGAVHLAGGARLGRFVDRRASVKEPNENLAGVVISIPIG